MTHHISHHILAKPLVDHILRQGLILSNRTGAGTECDNPKKRMSNSDNSRTC